MSRKCRLTHARIPGWSLYKPADRLSFLIYNSSGSTFLFSLKNFPTIKFNLSPSRGFPSFREYRPTDGHRNFNRPIAICSRSLGEHHDLFGRFGEDKNSIDNARNLTTACRSCSHVTIPLYCDFKWKRTARLWSLT